MAAILSRPQCVSPKDESSSVFAQPVLKSEYSKSEYRNIPGKLVPIIGPQFQ